MIIFRPFAYYLGGVEIESGPHRIKLETLKLVPTDTILYRIYMGDNLDDALRFD